MPYLVLVESPNKVKKIQGYLDELYGVGTYRVAATVGHWRGLPPMAGQAFSDVVDTATWAERFEVHNRKVAGQIGKLIKGADEVLLASDPDREGEAIAWHVVDEFRLRAPKRVVFTEITKAALKRAIENPQALDEDLAGAARARAVLDYAIGMDVSRLLWRFGAKSAGRVQSAALRIVIDREEAIKAFVPEDYWTVFADYAEGFSAGVCVWEEPSPEDLDENPDLPREKRLVPKRFKDEAEALAVVDAARKTTHAVAQIERKPGKRRPRPPYTTSSLQADCSTRFKWSADRTAKLAQGLFEQGHITYVRTDSVALAPEAIEMIRAFIQEKHPHLLPDGPQRYAEKKSAQGAHEAIRPTAMKSAQQLGLSGDDAKLYEAIFQRTLLCQCKSAVTEKTVVVIEPSGCDFRFMASGTVLKEKGWIELTSIKDPDALPALRQGQKLQVNSVGSKGQKTKPPARFTEASLIRYLERKGIGRPSTYPTIMRTLFGRDYVKKAKQYLVPAETGFLADRLTRGSFDSLTQEGFTAETEKQLDAIGDGKLARGSFLGRFYERFQGMLSDAQAFLDYYAKRHPELDQTIAKQHDSPCPQCQGRMLVRSGKFGAYAQCDNKDCGHRLNLTPLKTLGVPCPACGGSVVEQPYKKDGKRKVFYRCENGDWKDSAKPTKLACPQCAAVVLEQSYTKDRKKRVFYRCAGCDWKDSRTPPERSDFPCHADAQHGTMFVYSGTSKKTKKPYVFYRCHICRDAAPDDRDAGIVWSGPKAPACEDCGRPMRLRDSAKGRFWGCSGYPNCKKTKAFE